MWVRVWVRVRFDQKIYGLFGFGLFWILVKKIVFRTQNFWGVRVGSIFDRSRCRPSDIEKHVSCLHIFRKKAFSNKVTIFINLYNSNTKKKVFAICRAADYHRIVS